MAPQTVLVVGATGKQGGAVIKALLALPESASRFHILALTRNAHSRHARALADAYNNKDGSESSSVELVEGDSAHPQPIFDARPKGSIDSVFVVTVPQGKVSEEKQAIPLIDAAVAHGVRHVVFSSVDRGGDERSWTNPTTIKHFAAKQHVEVHLRRLVEKQEQEGEAEGGGESSKFAWTILRPVAFMDNWNPGMMCGMFTAMWHAALQPATKVQLVSVRDICVAAAQALSEPEKWAGRAVGLAGDALTLEEAKAVFEKVTGKTLPQSWTILARAVLWGVREVGEMFAWFEKEGYGVDIETLRREVPVQNFETWLREESKWKEG